jgi:hypothetical protein
MTEVQTASTLEDIVVADAHATALVAEFLELKRQMDALEALIAPVKSALTEAFVAAGAKRFTDANGSILLSRIEVQNPQAYDWAKLARLAPKALERSKLPRTTHYRLNPPRR